MRGNMTREKILSKILDMLNLGRPNMTDFSTRLKLQKIVYLLQASNMSLGYGFNWYVRGPYSPDLAKVLYEIYRSETIYEEGKTIQFMNPTGISMVLEDFKNKLGDNINNPTYLEVLASMHYINKVVFSGHGNLNEVKRRLLEAKPSLRNLEMDIIEKAYQNLSDFN